MAKEKIDPEKIGQWRLVKEALEAAGKTDSYFYKRAVSIIKTGVDPMRW